MAYVSQELKAKLAPTVKAVLKKYGMKGTLSVNNHSTLVLTVKSGKIDLIGNFNTVRTRRYAKCDQRFNAAQGSIQINEYHYTKHFNGVALDFVDEIVQAMNEGNWNRSDIQADYFDVGFYTNINVGTWDKPYVITA